MVRQRRVVIAVLFLLLVGNLSTVLVMNERIDTLNEEVDTIRAQNEQYKTDLAAIYVNSTSPTGALSSAHSVDVPLPLYETRDRSGTIASMDVANVPGEGTYIRIDKIVYRDTMQTAISASRAYLSEHSTYSLPYNAVIVSIDPKNSWEFLDGNSLQLPLTLGLLATNLNTTLDDSVVATGSISESGSVEPVGNIRSKVSAARSAGYETILVPDGQAFEANGIRVIEVATVEEAIEYALDSS